jgi:hypothetical protein
MDTSNTNSNIYICDKKIISANGLNCNFELHSQQKNFSVHLCHLIDDLQLKTNLEDCLNSDLKNLEGLLQRLRISLIIKHLKLLAIHSGFKSYENLSLIHFCDADVSAEFAKIEKNRLYVELNRHDDYLIVSLFRWLCRVAYCLMSLSFKSRWSRCVRKKTSTAQRKSTGTIMWSSLRTTTTSSKTFICFTLTSASSMARMIRRSLS